MMHMRFAGGAHNVSGDQSFPIGADVSQSPRMTALSKRRRKERPPTVARSDEEIAVMLTSAESGAAIGRQIGQPDLCAEGARLALRWALGQVDDYALLINWTETGELPK